MKVRTKYSIGDIVWCIFADEPMQCRITDVELIETENTICIAYSVSTSNERIFGTRFTAEIFSTEEEAKKVHNKAKFYLDLVRNGKIISMR